MGGIRDYIKDKVMESFTAEDGVRMISMVLDIYKAVKDSDKGRVLGEALNDIAAYTTMSDELSVTRDVNAIRRYIEAGLTPEQAMALRVQGKIGRLSGIDALAKAIAERLSK